MDGLEKPDRHSLMPTFRASLTAFPTPTDVWWSPTRRRKVAYMRGPRRIPPQRRRRRHGGADRDAAMLGAQNLVVTGGVGSVRADMHPGNLVVITDHINFGGINPLIGMSADGGPRVAGTTPTIRNCFDASSATLHCGVQTHEGVMMSVLRPTFETPAEIKMSRTLGADVVTMSMVPEVILARRLGINVAAVGPSPITARASAAARRVPPPRSSRRRRPSSACDETLRALPKTREMAGRKPAITWNRADVASAAAGDGPVVNAMAKRRRARSAGYRGPEQRCDIRCAGRSLAMAVFFRGMDAGGRRSDGRHGAPGRRLDMALSLPFGPVLDKHSTGGIGDHVSLALAPLVATCGGFVP